MNKKNFKRAAILWAYLPILIFQTAAKYWKFVMLIIFFAAVFIFANSKTIVKASGKTSPAVINSITDLTTAFKTNSKKNCKNKYIVLHHTGSNGANLISDILKQHLKENGWSKIGYHYFIDNENNVFQLLPETEGCPNALHRNFDAVAICLAGDYSQKQVSEETLQTLAALCKDIMFRNQISIENVVKHCDVPDNNTECCGNNFDLNEFKKLLK